MSIFNVNIQKALNWIREQVDARVKIQGDETMLNYDN